MRFPDARYYARIASTTGFRPEPLERVFRLSSLLHGIVREIGDEVSLRGGTALNLLHLDVPRLSVDLDLDYVGTADATAARNRRPALLSGRALLRPYQFGGSVISNVAATPRTASRPQSIRMSIPD